MLGVNQSDFMSYMSALKSNYRKGVHRMEAILSNPTHAKEFAANLGGVSVVLGLSLIHISRQQACRKSAFRRCCRTGNIRLHGIRAVISLHSIT